MKKILPWLAAFLLVASFGNAAYVARVSAQGIDAKQLVQLLIALGFISPDKVGAAQAAVGLTSASSSSAATGTKSVVRKDGKIGPFVPRIDSLGASVVAVGDSLSVTGVGFDASNKAVLDGIAYPYLASHPVGAQDPDTSLSILIPETLGSASSVGPHTLLISNENGTSCAVSITIVPRGMNAASSFVQKCGGTEPALNGYTYKGPGSYKVGEDGTAVWTYGIPFGGSEACRFKCLEGAVWTGTVCAPSSAGALH